jgi:hypothetical protein
MRGDLIVVTEEVAKETDKAGGQRAAAIGGCLSIKQSALKQSDQGYSSSTWSFMYEV